MSSTYLTTVDIKTPPAVFPEDPAITYKFSLDNWQKHAISAIDAKENVLVTAKTGSGKTLVAEYQIAHSLRKGRRVFYTTPIKSLSNQKFHDLKEMFPSVGIMTGDIKFRPDADVVIMTTEILQNLLFKRGTATESLGLTASLSLEGVDAVIFDEVHYINNADRGKVWEQTLILLPPEVSLILLSATISRPDLFASWLGDLKQVPIKLIPTSHRIVPLTHSVFIGDELVPLLDSRKEIFDERAYINFLNKRRADFEREKEFRKRAQATKADGEHKGPVEGKFRVDSFEAQLNKTVEYLQAHELLPALFFVFSRKQCEEYAKKIEGALIDSSDAAAVRHIIDYHLRHHKESLQGTTQYWELIELLKKGIAYHHSGLLPVLKEMVEILFGKGYIKVMFCTETFAVGINMPTKTAVFLELTKYSEGARRPLHTDEYTQMAGRAGRRGLDTFGQVIYLPAREPITATEMRGVLTGQMPCVQSRLVFDYDFILKSFHSGQDRWATIIKNSYMYQEMHATVVQLRSEIASVETAAAALGLTAAQISDLEYRDDIRAAIKDGALATTKTQMDDGTPISHLPRKTLQKMLDQWGNKHMGATWAKAEEAFKKYRSELNRLQNLRQQLADLETSMAAPSTLLTERINMLISTGFLEADGRTLTTKGVLATEFNEGNSLLMAEFFETADLKHLSRSDLATVLAAFCPEKNDSAFDQFSYYDLTVSDAVKETLRMLVETGWHLMSAEVKAGFVATSDDWKISYIWVQIISDWLAGKQPSAICQELGMYEGNLTKGLLKVSAVIEEWKSACTFRGCLEGLEALEGMDTEIVRGIVVPDSLYLHL
jgi:superfamily II RNA helicase